MPSWIRSVVFIVSLGGVVGASAASASAQDEDRRRVRHNVKQANLYLKMNLAVRARELLTETVADEPGRSDPGAWLALGRVFFVERKVDEAGRAVRQARRLGLKEPARSKWARAFLDEYDSHVGSLVLDGGTCRELRFQAELAAPMVNVTRRALLDSATGWRTGTLTRQRGERFYLPAGRYRFGSVKVSVLAGELVRLSSTDIGADCAPPPGLAAAPAGAPPPGGEVVAPASVAAEEESSWFEDNWVWLVVGAVVIAGGTGTAVALSSGGGPDQVNFNPNPSSFRGE